MPAPYDVVVIGGGIVGVATARALLIERPKLQLAILEKERSLALHQTGRNSGVLHSGIYYTPGSLKAELCMRGKTAMEHFAHERGIPFEAIGKLIVALNNGELARLENLRRRATANRVSDVRELTGEEIQTVEPHVRGIRALHLPHTGVIDYQAVLGELLADVRRAGGEMLLNREVVRMRPRATGVEIQTTDGAISCRSAIACAGLQSDRLARRSGIHTEQRIVPFRGDYYTLSEPAAAKIRGLVYPVPDPHFPFLGVHFTRKTNGTVIAGPNAVLAFAREGYHRASVDLHDAADALSFPGIWRFALRHGKTAAAEMWRDLSKRAFVADMQRYVPSLTAKDATFGPTGIRAQAMRSDGILIDNFVIEGGNRMMHVLNAPSPGATASLAIGEELARRALRDVIS